MFALIYLSNAHEVLSPTDLESIMNVSLKNNWYDQISGVLIYMEGLFFQVLEGPESNVRECFARIKQDPRHHEIQVLEARETEVRYFPDWGMAFQHVPKGALPPAPGIKSLEDIASFEALFSQPQHVVNKWLRHLNSLMPISP